MIEAMLWTMADPLLATQCGAPPKPQGNHSDRHFPHGAWRCAGDDDWVSVAVGSDNEWRNLCAIVAALSPMMALNSQQRIARRDTIDGLLGTWLRTQTADAAEATLLRGGVPAAALANALDLVGSNHLRERGFWEAHDTGVLPGLPWRASFGRTSGAAPGLGADTDTVLAEVLELSADEIAALRQSGALG
jgi:crotonobetainyl-CoA:carnitine CoA-transferase CaiB-like acyl-CoA transferase